MILVKKVLDLVRANFLPASIIPFFLGAALAFHSGYELTALKLFIGLSGVISAHLACNASNNYYDHASGADGPCTVTTPFFGGTKIISSGEVSPAAAALTSAVFGIYAIFAGILIFFITENPVFIMVTAFSAILASQYTAGPFKLSYKGMGELVIFILFGPLLIVGSYYLFSENLSFDSLMLSFIPGGLIFAVIICNEIPDDGTDKKAGKKNLVVILGREKGKILYAAGVLFSAIFLAICVGKGVLPPVSAVSAIFYFIPVKVLREIRNNTNNISTMTKAGKLTVITHLLVTLTITAALVF
ncbi:MAG: prenyltransferase [Candidatus Omnitrophota bacterium]